MGEGAKSLNTNYDTKIFYLFIGNEKTSLTFGKKSFYIYNFLYIVPATRNVSIYWEMNFSDENTY